MAGVEFRCANTDCAGLHDGASMTDREALVERIAYALLPEGDHPRVWGRKITQARAALAVVEAEQGGQAERHRALVVAAREIWAHRFDEVALPPDMRIALGAALEALEVKA